MNVAVDILPGVVSGLDRWQRETVRALADAEDQGQLGRLTAFCFGKRYIRPDWLPDNFDFRSTRLPGRVQTLLCRRAGVPVETLYGIDRADVVLCMLLHPLTALAPTLLAVADVSWRTFAGQYRTTFSHLQVDLAERAIGDADHILTISQASADDLVRGGVSDDRLTVAHLGIAEEFLGVTDQTREAVRQKYGLPAEFVLYVGGVNERKNVAVLVNALDHLEPRPLLIIAGLPPEEGLRYWNLDRPHIRHLGYVAADDLPGLYDAATVFVFPSKMEGFGLPLVEAAAAGAPVLAADIPVFREVGGMAIDYFHPEDACELSKRLKQVLSDHSVREQMGRRSQQLVTKYTRDRYRHSLLSALTRAAARRAIPPYA